MTMRVKPETKAMLERVKNLHPHVDSLDEAVSFLMESSRIVRSKFYSWLREISPYGQRDKYVLFDSRDDDDVITAKIYTKHHVYRITAHLDGSYLGCIGWTTFYRPGEEHTRGNDLPDGDFSEKTWNSIKNAIIKYELQEISDYVLNPPEPIADQYIDPEKKEEPLNT